MRKIAYHYTESGLDNIWLVNGYKIHKTPYGEGVSIHNTEGLHKAIALWLINLPKPLTGAELRFIRTDMELTQKNMAGILGATEQSLRLLEKHKNKDLSGTVDHLVRGIYADYRNANGSLYKMIERLNAMEKIQTPKVQLKDTRSGWRIDLARS